MHPPFNCGWVSDWTVILVRQVWLGPIFQKSLKYFFKIKKIHIYLFLNINEYKYIQDMTKSQRMLSNLDVLSNISTKTKFSGTSGI